MCIKILVFYAGSRGTCSFFKARVDIGGASQRVLYLLMQKGGEIRPIFSFAQHATDIALYST